MSSSTYFSFDQRAAEVDFYISVIIKLYDVVDEEKKYYDEDEEGSSNLLLNIFQYDEFDGDDFLKILKSNAFILLYNLIESSISNFILRIYDEIEFNELRYSEVCEKIQSIWFGVKYNHLSHTTTNYDKHKEKAIEMINLIVEDTTIELGDSVQLNGNADYRSIKLLLNDHGVIFNFEELDKTSVGGSLFDIKNKRNALAHGNESFVDAARDHTTTDLINYKNEVIFFLNQIKNDVEKYIQNEDYKSV